MRIRTKRHELIITPGKCISETREFKTDMRDRRKIHSGRTSRSWTVGIWKRVDDDYDIMINANQLAMPCNNESDRCRLGRTNTASHSQLCSRSARH